MTITYCIISYKNHMKLDYIKYCNLEDMFNFIKEQEPEANEYNIITYVNGTEVARDTILT